MCNQLIVALQKCVLTIIALRFEYVKKRREKKGGNRKIVMIVILLKNPMNASTRLSMNGKSPMISPAPPFVLRLSKDERRVFQQNQLLCRTLVPMVLTNERDPGGDRRANRLNALRLGGAEHFDLLRPAPAFSGALSDAIENFMIVPGDIDHAVNCLPHSNR